jgi:hypothetical protein
MASRVLGLPLARGQLFGWNRAHHWTLEASRLPEHSGRQLAQREAKDEVQIHLDPGGRAGCAVIGEVELATGMVVAGTLNSVATTSRQKLDRALDLRTIAKHDVPLDAGDVVEVEVDRETRRRTEREIECGAALEGESRPEEWDGARRLEAARRAE